jgi:hypothetical protein
MLYWICPECGHECSPAIRECPTCTAASSQAPTQKPTLATAQTPVPNEARTSEVQQHIGVSRELLSLAQNFQSVPSTGLLSAAPQRKLLVAAKGSAVAVEEPEQPAAPELREPEPSLKMAPLDGVALNPAGPTQWDAVKLSLVPVPVPLSGPALAPGFASARAATVAELSLQLADLAAAGEIHFQPASDGQRAALDQSIEPLLSRRRSVAFVRPQVPTADHSGLGMADLAQLLGQPGDARLKPVVPYRNGQPGSNQPQPTSSVSIPSLVDSRVEPSGEFVADLMHALQASAEERERAAIGAIQASFRERPVARLLAAPADIVKAPAPPAEQWMHLEKPKFTAIAPEYAGRRRVIAGPQSPPLAGPSLPPQLVNLDQQNSKLRLRRKRVAGWPLTLLVGTVVILGAGSLFQYVAQNRDAKASAVAVPDAPVEATPAPAVAAPILREHPAAKSVEVAGVRIVTGANKKPQLQFVVINHSASELSGLDIRIAVRSVDALAGPPLFSISSPVAALGPNQSKEIRTELDPSIQTSSIPDWQSLRTEVTVGRQ